MHFRVDLTCLHELGHALGLRHTDAFDEIMYSFQHGGDLVEYFSRYLRQLKSRADVPPEVGALTGLKTSSVRVLLFRAGRRLRAFLAESGINVEATRAMGAPS